jgi:hypothetical protein
MVIMVNKYQIYPTYIYTSIMVIDYDYIVNIVNIMVIIIGYSI